uniref:S-protein homolog n=1 Tax=Manihot esculenta TaxID=3983 RepID=A0A2C9U4C6_MANES
MIIISKQKFIFCTILVLSTMSAPSSAEKSIINKIIDFLMPLIEVRLTNNASYDIPFMCETKNYDQSLHILKSGQQISWSITDIMFPLSWCYLHLNDTNHGVFWIYQVRLGCNKCNWTIQDDGLFLLKDNNFKEPHSLFINGEYF